MTRPLLCFTLLACPLLSQLNPRDEARALLRQGRYAEAETLLRSALQDPPDPGLLLELGVTLSLQGRLAGSQPVLARALEALEKTYGPGAPELLPVVHTLSRVHEALGEKTPAEVLLLRGITLREAAGPAALPGLAADLQTLGRFYLRQERWAVAEPHLRRALAILEQRHGPDYLALAAPLDLLATACHRLQRLDEAEALLRRALVLRETNLGPRHQDVASTLDNLGAAVAEQKRFPEAELVYARSLQIWTALLGPNHSLVAACLDNLASAAAAQRKYAEAEQHSRRALEIREYAVVRTGHNIAVLLEAQDRVPPALALYRTHQPLLDRLPADASLKSIVQQHYRSLLRRTGRRAVLE
jgi:tetratricopeptide (TPR) repeat protein